ncbi:alpha/beta hydrolase [Streptomyces kunmingensis]
MREERHGSPPVPFAPELVDLLERMGPPHENAPATAAQIPQWRAQVAEADPTLDELRDGGRFDVQERLVPGPAGAPQVPLVIARPSGVGEGAPVIYHMHGGGMMAGTSRTGLAPVLREWAEPLGCVVVAVDYRLAPEHVHPAAIEDCYAGPVWVAQRSASFGGDAERIVIAGGSAGGGLTAALALLARDRQGPRLIGQLAMCPMLDDRNDSPSARQMTGLGVWDRHANDLGWTSVLGEALRGTHVSPYAAAARATDLSGLPPAYIDVGAAETYRDESVRYATGLWEAGGDAELHVWAGAVHGFDQTAPHTDLAADARAARFGWLRRLLNRTLASGVRGYWAT